MPDDFVSMKLGVTYRSSYICIYLYAIMKTMFSPRYHHNDFWQHDIRLCYTHLASVRFDHSAYCELLLTTSNLLLVLKKIYIRLSNESIKREKVKKL